jgi:hypothetical protein
MQRVKDAGARGPNFLPEHDLSENRFPPRIKSGAGFFGIMLLMPRQALG